MNITYHDFPVVPEYIKKQVLEQASLIEYDNNSYNLTGSNDLINSIKKLKPEFTKDSLGVPFDDAQNYFDKKIANFAFLDASNELVEWVKNNIPLKIRGTNIQVMHGGEIITPHIDEIRSSALNYILSPGGDNVSTSFYISNDPNLMAMPQMAFPYNRLNLLESNVIPCEQWHTLNVQKIHGVENLDINKHRISISISL